MPTAALRRGAARMPGESRAECRSRNIHPGCGTDHRTSGSRSQPCRTCCPAAFSERLIQLFVVRPSAVNDEHSIRCKSYSTLAMTRKEKPRGSARPGWSTKYFLADLFACSFSNL